MQVLRLLSWFTPGAAARGAFAILVLCLAGCAIGPDYQRPGVAMPAAFKEAPDGWKVAQPGDHADRGDWWSVFHDSQLDALEKQVDRANQNVAAYLAAYQQARALVAEARAAYFPTLGLAALGSRASSRGRAATYNAANGVISPNGSVSNSFSVSLDASWEPDLWGRVSRAVRAQRTTAQSAAADLANARLSAQATLAQDYFQVRALDATQKLLDDTVSAYQEALRMTQNRYAQGVAARSDVIQAQTQLQSAQAAAIDNGITRAQYEHAVAVLVGLPPSAFAIRPAPLDAVPPPLPVGVPSSLLERRPDIASAERKAAAANEQIGIAMAAYFPTLTLSANGGFASTVLSQLLRSPSRFWTVGPHLAATFFDAGLRHAQTEAARAAYDQNVAAYRQSVLTAFQDVEDNLASLRILEREQVIQQRAVQFAQQALQIVLNQYKVGTVAYLDVITAQATALIAQERLTTIAGQRMTASVGLIKALGGGWDVSNMNRESSQVPLSRDTDGARQTRHSDAPGSNGANRS